MKFKWYFIIFLTTIFIYCSSNVKAFDDAVVAVVNDELITLKDVKDYNKMTYVTLVNQNRPATEINEIMMDLEVNGIQKLIEDKLILSKAKEMDLQIREEAVDERVEELKKKFSSEDAFKKNLDDNGVTVTDLRNKIRDQLKIKYIIDHEIRSKIKVNPKDVTQYYDDHKNQFKHGDRVYVESIYIAFNNDKDKAWIKAEEVVKKIRNGEDFIKLAGEYSDSESVGVVERDQLKKEIEDLVFNMRVGEVSNVVEVENGLYIFLITGKAPPKEASFKEVEDFVYDLVYRQKFQEKYEKWVAKLKSEAYIEIK